MGRRWSAGWPPSRSAGCERLVDGVVHHLVDEVVEAHDPGRADVHAGALANRLEALEDSDVLGVVARGSARYRRVVHAAFDDALFRAVATCCQWPSDDVRTPRIPGREVHGRGGFRMSQIIAGEGLSRRRKTPLNPCKLPGNWVLTRTRRGGVGAGRPLAGAATQLADELPAESLVDAGDELPGHQVELLGPHGRLACHREHAVALGRGPGGGGYGGAGHAPPDLLDTSEGGRRRDRRGQVPERRRERSRGGSAQAAIASWRIVPGEMRRRVTWASPAVGTWPRSVVAITLCPAAESSPTSNSRRSPSSSLITSSRSISGVRPRSRASTERSARSSARSASRCSPCEP